MKPMEKYVSKLNSIVNDLLNNPLATDINLWKNISNYFRETSSRMASNGIHVTLSERPYCNLYKDYQFNKFSENFMKLFSAIKSKNISEENHHAEYVRKYLMNNEKEKLIAFTMNENYIVINEFSNKEFDTFFLSRCLFAVLNDEYYSI